jgi:hypothetical protein
LLATELPIVIILGTTLTAADPAVIVTEARARHHAVALFLIADPGDPAVAELRPRVTEVFQKPTNFEALAAAIERVAVEVERAELEDYEVVEIGRVEAPMPRVPTQPYPDAVPLVRAQRTEILSEGGLVTSAFPATRGRRNGDGRPERLLRADEAMGELDAPDLTRQVPGTREHTTHFENRSAMARTLDRELSQAERRLFPDQASTPAPFRSLEYDDALSDIDLDALAIDTIPGLNALDPERASRSGALLPSGVPALPPMPLRPVQEEGSLGDDDVAELLARLHEHSFTGAFAVRRPEGDKVLFFDQGQPVAARSALRHDHLTELLFREGKLSREQAVRARGNDTQATSRAIALQLVEQGLLKESEVFPTLRRYVEEVFHSLFALENGRYELGPSLPEAADRVRLPSLWVLLFEGVRRKYGPERLAARLGGRELVLHPTTLFARVVEVSALTVEERRVAALFDGERSLAEVRIALGNRVAESAVSQVAFALRVTGALETDASKASHELRSASTVISHDLAAERRAQPRVLDPAQVALEETVERERISAKRAQVMDADYFTVLGVGREANAHELQRAHARLRADFDAVRFTVAVAAENADALAEIADVLDEALRVLAHPGVRARYIEHLLPAGESEDA